MAWLTGTWSDIYFVTSRSETRRWIGCKHAPGTYRLVALKEAEASGPEALKRIHGTDETGTLYIGRSDDLQSQVERLAMQYRPGPEARNHAPASEVSANVLGFNGLGVSWEFAADEASAREREDELLAAYRTAFGESPPLNLQGSKSRS